jgi:hypothetical protein
MLSFAVIDTSISVAVDEMAEDLPNTFQLVCGGEDVNVEVP